jgi:hypothetical protein
VQFRPVLTSLWECSPPFPLKQSDPADYRLPIQFRACKPSNYPAHRREIWIYDCWPEEWPLQLSLFGRRPDGPTSKCACHPDMSTKLSSFQAAERSGAADLTGARGTRFVHDIAHLHTPVILSMALMHHMAALLIGTAITPGVGNDQAPLCQLSSAAPLGAVSTDTSAGSKLRLWPRRRSDFRRRRPKNARVSQLLSTQSIHTRSSCHVHRSSIDPG